MAFKRKRVSAFRRSRKRTRKAVVSRPMRMVMPAITVTRTWYAFNWSPGTATTTDFWKYFTNSPTGIPNWSEYSSLFDLFRVNSLKYVLRPRYDNYAGNDTTDTTLPGVTNQGTTMMHAIIDPSSTVTPSGTYTSANLNSFLENGKVRTYRGTSPITLLVRYPKYADDVNGTAGSKYTGRTWLSTKIGSTPFRGVHVFAQDVNLTGTFGQSFDIFVTMNISFKGMA